MSRRVEQVPGNTSKTAVAKHVVREEFKEMSIAEFIFREEYLLGFENPAKALYQTIREYVENALDATDLHNILPNITIIVRQDSQNKDRCLVVVEDNGIGIPPNKVPEALGKPLVTSKFKIKQTRGRFGLGAKAVTIYALKHTNTPIEVYTSPGGSERIYYYKLSVDIRNAQPLVYSKASWRKTCNWQGTRVSAIIKCNWSKARHRILEYLRRLAIVTPYADIVFIYEGPNSIEVHHYPRVTDKIPPPPKEVKPHPKGIEIGMLKDLLKHTSAPTLKEFLMKTFQRVGEKTANMILSKAGLDPYRNPKSLTDNEIEKLFKAMQSLKYVSPSSEALSPLGPEIIEAGLKAVLKPEFVVAVTRKPKTHSEGHPFIVEVGIAYGGGVPVQDHPMLLRYANRIPLIYDEKSDVAWKVLEEFNWRHYNVEFPAPIAVLTHICSTKIPWKGANKEAVAEVEEIKEELHLALQEAARKLRRYLIEKKREEELREKIATFLRYIPEVAASLATILRNDGLTQEKIQEMLINALKKRMKGKELKLLEEQVKNLPKIKIEA